MNRRMNPGVKLLISVLVVAVSASCLWFLLFDLPNAESPTPDVSVIQGSDRPSFRELLRSNILDPIKTWFNSLGSPDRPVCGREVEWTVLLVGIDYRDGDYLYGLADVIRVARVDFTRPQVNVAAIPRNLLVTPPASLPVQSPLLLNQAYFFGTEGMGYYQGEGYGAGALGATLESSFGVTPQHYLVVNFQAFEQFIDAIGGIEVDLPEPVDNLPDQFFPAGKQTLNGEQALTLGRIRKKYSDLVRINNQTLVLQGVLNRLKDPAVLVQLPELSQKLRQSVFSNATPRQVNTLLCLLPKLGTEDVHFFSPPEDLLAAQSAYIPSLDTEMQVFGWDQRFVEWLKASLEFLPAE